MNLKSIVLPLATVGLLSSCAPRVPQIEEYKSPIQPNDNSTFIGVVDGRVTISSRGQWNIGNLDTVIIR